MNTTKLAKTVKDALKAAPDFITKETFHKEGAKVLRQLAKELGCTEFKVRSNKGGDGIIGEVVLHTPKLYIQLGPEYPQAVMYRTCKGMKDYTGGVNNWCDIDALEDLERFRRLMPSENQTQKAEVSGEEAFEMLAAFGPGVDVVNVLTGQRHKT